MPDTTAGATTDTVTGATTDTTAGAATGAGELAGCAALVTGASSGIGAATALALAGRGAVVALVARRADRLDELAGRIRAAGGTALPVPADLTDPGAARRAVDDAVARLGRLDVLVNNAGHGVRGAVENADPDDWDLMVDLNVRAVLHTSRAALPHLLHAAARGPRHVADLVNVSSAAGRVPRRDNSVYSATKHAVCSFSEALRQEVAARHVRVGLVEPGMTATEMTEGSQSASARGLPPSAWLHPADIADAVVYMTTRPRHAAVNEMLVRPTAQEH